MAPSRDEKGNHVIQDTLRLLERGEKEIELDEKRKDVIMVLGNTGSGKSTFTQWMAGDNSKLISKETQEGTGEYIIEDQNRIGNSTLKSKTVFPELVVDPKTNEAYYDCPGFSDTQGSSHDISTTYFIKRVLDHSERVKLVFTVSHPSLRKGVDRQDFTKLLRHVTDLVKDIDKFKHSIAMVATKVDNQYIRQGDRFALVADDKVVAAIAGFLQEAKQYLEGASRIPNLTEKQKRFYESAIQFVEVLLEKEGDSYTRIGLFRRPDRPGPLSAIPLLQEGKQNVETIVRERLDFTVKNNEDFGYTVSDKTKNDIYDVVEEINKNLWSRLSGIAGSIQKYYQNLIGEVRDKIHSLVSDAKTVEFNYEEAEAFTFQFNSALRITSEASNKLKNVTSPEHLGEIINSTILQLEVNLSEDDIPYIENQGNYFSFLQTVSDKTLSLMPWHQLFEDVESYLSNSKMVVLNDINLSAKKINNRIYMNLTNIIGGIQKEYNKKIKCLDLQNLPEKLNRDSIGVFELTEEIRNGTTTGKLVRTISSVADNLGISLPKQSLQNVVTQGKYLQVLEVMGNGTVKMDQIAWLPPFENIAQYFYETEKWYTFLEDLYNKFSEYEIQKERQRYNVADLEDWDQPGRPQGISVTPNTFQQFLDKIGNFNVSEYEAMKTLTATDLQIEELNKILSLTLKHRPTVVCSETNVVVKGSYISLAEAMNNILRNFDTNNSCDDFNARFESRKFKLFKFIALNKVFIDTDLSFSGKGISVAVIAPTWQVVESSRRIDLSGADGTPQGHPKARNGSYGGADGKNGVPGNSGTSGESFFGIGTNFVGGERLEIISQGGKGGPGQGGGDGANGVTGRSVPTPLKNDPDCENGLFRNDYKCVKLDEVRSVVLYTEIRRTYRIYGVPGGKGGDGGDGGRGGRGGRAGSIAILELGGDSNIKTITSTGKEGDAGRAGRGGPGGRNGDDVKADFSSIVMRRCFRNCYRREWSMKERIVNNRGPPAGSDGINGRNAVGLQDPVAANGIGRMSDIINEYKIFLLENISNCIQKHSRLRFLNKLNQSDDVRKLYDPPALIDEFVGLERQFHQLGYQMNLSPFYSSLLERISVGHRDSPDSNENRKVLNYLYTAALSRLYNLKENSESSLIIDIRKYLNLITDNVKALKDLETENNKVEVVNRYKDNYKKGIDKKLKEAEYFIKKQIHEIESLDAETDDWVNSLIEETILFQKKAEEERTELANKREELEKALSLNAIFGLFKIVGGIYSLLGPVGEIAGTVIEATTTVAESLTLSNQQKAFNLSPNVVSAVTTVDAQIKKVRNKSITYLSKLLEDLSDEIRKNPEKLNDMTVNLERIEEELKTASERKLNPRQVKELENELRRELEIKIEDLKTYPNEAKSVAALKAIEKIVRIAKFGSLLIDLYDNIKEDDEKMNVVSEAMQNIDYKIQTLREFEERIYDTIAPMLQELEDQMKDIRDKLGSKSRVALDITRWQVQGTLKDMRLLIESFTEGFETKVGLSRSIEKLEDAMTTLINVYDRIQSYQEQQNLANYIADISVVKNEELDDSLSRLDASIKSNIVLTQYRAAIDAFKQWVFPLADRYIEKHMLPSQLELETNIQNLVKKATREIEEVKTKLDLYDASVQEGDQYLETDEFSNRYISSKPFFEWKNDKFGSSIADLLSGKEVVLKADVRKSPQYRDAIKFSMIDLQFKVDNQTSQSLLYETLKGFDIRATHLGNSHYRYNSKIFSITSDAVTISYSFDKNDAGLPIRSNGVYKKLKAGDLVLSPYTLWEFRLINQTSQYSFEDLKKYKNDIDIELAGFGSYVNTYLNMVRSAPYDSFAEDNTVSLEYKAIDFARLVSEIVAESNYVTNGAPKGISSPISLCVNFLRTFFSTKAIASINQIFRGEQSPVTGNDCLIFSGKQPTAIKNDCPIFSGEQLSVTDNNCPMNKFFGEEQSSIPKNYCLMNPIFGGEQSSATSNDCAINKKFGPEQSVASSRHLQDRAKTRKIGLESKPPLTVTEKVATASSEDYNCKEKNGPKSCTVYNLNLDGKHNCSSSFLLSDRNPCLSTQVPDLNCTLFLADWVSRTVTGNNYKSPTADWLLSPREVILGKMNNGMVRCENDVKQMLQSHLSEKEDSVWFGKLTGYAKWMLQSLGLIGIEETEEYVKDVRYLFA